MKLDKITRKLDRWEDFKKELPHLKQPFSKRSWGSNLHSVCSYQGKMKPALAHHLVNVFSEHDETVLDPFSGSGTIPFEAAINQRYGIGMDIGLLPVALSNAKLKRHDPTEVKLIIENLESYIENNVPSKRTLTDLTEVGFNKTITEYYHPNTLQEVLLARDFFILNGKPELENWSLVFSCMLHILHGNRPYALSRNSHPITPYAPTGEYIYKNLIEKLTTKVEKSLEAQQQLTILKSECFFTDILEDWPSEIKKVDAIITSPPFFDSTKFYMSNWLRYWFCGWSKSDFQEFPKSFIEVQQKKSFNVYDFIFEQCHKRLNEDGIVVFHLGFSKKCDMAESLRPHAEKYFTVRDIFTESVEHCGKHGISDQGSVKGHQYLVLTK